jgi:diguanylate cyclase (GGDEF)-like protein
MLDPLCPSCGGTLAAIPAGAVEEANAEHRAAAAPRRARGDGTTVLALLVVGPWLLPLVGLSVGDIGFLVPLVLLAFATQRLTQRARECSRWRPVLLSFAFATSSAAVASAVAMASTILQGETSVYAFYAGAAASAGLVAGAVLLARLSLGARRWSGLVDAGLVGLVVLALGVWFLIVPGLRSGDLLLTAVVAADLAALLLVGLSAVARGSGPSRPAEWWAATACLAATAGDGLVCATASDQLAAPPFATALAWSVAGFAFAAGADHGFDRERRATDEEQHLRFLVWRVALPLAAVLTLPATAGLLALAGDLEPAGVVYFVVLSVLALGLAFGRQAHLLVERQLAVVSERRLRREATLRSEELEALTGLATTMTQTLEEAPIVEQALGVLHAAARATSAALHVETEEGPRRLAAAAGAWHTEREWAPTDPVDGPQVTARGRREVLRLPLAARGRRIGTVTLVRPASQPFEARGIELLGLLVDQMAVAVQNAREYREKLEQAIRDPLTGLYNRRFLLEALEKEVQRSERYGSDASLVIFDVDDFKHINDGYGHAAGDEVLRRIGAAAETVIRPVDSFARIGGEEFALLLPETSQLEALLVADRVRTAVSRQRILPEGRVTLSGGVASCPVDATDAELLQRRADAALYWAKRNGKDLCAVASEATAAPAGDVHDGVLAHLYALVAMIDARQLHTRDHSENVAAYAVGLGQHLGLSRERLVKLRRAAMLHDVGKVAVRSDVLAKPGPLTDEEYQEILAHPVVGGTMLAHAGLEEEAAWVRHHHERVDGRGYPDRLAEPELPVEARILFVADAFEAMTSDRPYRDGMSVADAVEELRRCSGSQFDPQVVDAFTGLLDAGRLTVLALRAGG